MYSRLELLPPDVLQHIVFLACSSIFKPPAELLHLMLVSRTLWCHLTNAPHLHATIFRQRFDTSALQRRSGQNPTNSAQAYELENRYRLLRRVRRKDFSSGHSLLQDLWTALWMVVESDGLNEEHLRQAQFESFLLGVARFHFGTAANCMPMTFHETEMGKVLVWLLALTLSRGTILTMSVADRGEVYRWIVPYLWLSNKLTDPAVPPCQTCPETLPNMSLSQIREGQPPRPSECDQGPLVSIYQRRQHVLVPDVSIGALDLANALWEASQLKVPRHLPATRAIAIATGSIGPSQEEFRIFSAYRTPLFADLTPSQSEMGTTHSSDSAANIQAPVVRSRSMLHDADFSPCLLTSSTQKSYCNQDFSYSLGMLTGLWEGTTRLLNLNPSAATYSKPIQCYLREYVCVESFGIDIPDVFSFNDIKVQSSSEILFDGRLYRQWVGPPESTEVQNDIGSAMREVSYRDVIFMGQTLQDHEDAWGQSYRYLGKIRRDGTLVLQREDLVDTGIFVFEGHLRMAKAFVGRFKPITLPHHTGIFSMSKTEQLRL